MLVFKHFFVFLFLILLWGCSSNNNSPSKELIIRKYKETPQFIKSFMDSISSPEKFLIAEKGEQWAAGCIRLENEPSRQFISAILNKKQFTMEYMQGGIATVKNYIVINFGITGIVSYYINGQLYKVQ